MSTQPNHNTNKDNDWIWLPAMIILFAIGLWPIALVVLFWKVFKDDKTAAKRGTHPYDARKTGQTAAGSSAKTAAGSSAKTAAGSSAKTAASDRAKGAAAVQAKGKKIRTGKGMTVLGAVLSAVFGIGTMATGAEFAQLLFSGRFAADELVALLTCLAALICGLVLLCLGIGQRRRRERWMGYLGYIGANRTVDLARMAAAYGLSVGRLCRDLRAMLTEKVLPSGYLDLAEGKLILTETGYQAPPPEPPGQKKAQQPAQDDNAILQEIRAVNDAIPDPVMSAKIDRIGEITGKILDYQRSNPGKNSQLRGFLNYYLPTTLKILHAYAQLDAQGVEGENITAAKQRIEGMMDKVVEGFETQLDRLFANSAMDISSDVAVLERMLEKDGLSGADHMSMTL